MYRRIAAVFLGDSFAKMVNIGISLYLISWLSLSEYAYYTIVFTSIMMGYQAACGIIERLYIADHDKYKNHEAASGFIISVPIGFLLLVYVFAVSDLAAGMLFLAGYTGYVCYQILRISAQKKESFKKFIVFELSRTLIWALSTALLVAIGVRPADYYLLALIVAAWIMVVGSRVASSFRYAPAKQISTMRQGLIYIRSSSDVVIYSLLTATMPYSAVIFASLFSSNEAVATYGAAMRYQAIFSMIVYSINVVLLPRMASDSQHALRVLVSDVYGKLPYLLVAVLIAVGGIWVAMPAVGAQKYPGAQIVFLIFAVCSVCSLLSAPAATYLLALKKYREMRNCIFLGSLGVLVSLPILLSMSKFYGSALASCFGYICCCIALLHHMKKTQ